MCRGWAPSHLPWPTLVAHGKKAKLYRCFSLFLQLMPTQFEKDVSLWRGNKASTIPKSELTYIDFPDQKHVVQKRTTLIATGKGQVFSKSGVMVPSCCKAMGSMQLSTFGTELWLAHQHSAWHVWIMVIPVCADMGRHFMVFWSCRWPLRRADLLFVLLEVRTWFLFGLHNPQKNCRDLKWDAATLCRCFVKWWRSFAGDSKLHIEKP